MASNGAPQQGERPSRFQSMIEHLTHASNHVEEALNIVSTLNHDLSRANNFLINFRDTLVRTITDNGGEAVENIETQIRDFLPKALRQAKE